MPEPDPSDDPAPSDGVGARPAATLRFVRVFPRALPPLRADKAALGVVPTMAFRHCEPLRQASAFGWYVFPATDIVLRYTGSETLLQTEGGWQVLDKYWPAEFSAHWNEHAPDDLVGFCPPLVSQLPVAGVVQIWSGLLCSAAPDWSVLVRPLANIRGSHLYFVHEGIVEADRFGPFPLIINLQLIAPGVDIVFPMLKPLFQVQPLLRATYLEAAHAAQLLDGIGAPADAAAPRMSEADWRGFRRTVRLEELGSGIEPGSYAQSTRKRARHDGDAAGAPPPAATQPGATTP
jgi:hypothetical protein